MNKEEAIEFLTSLEDAEGIKDPQGLLNALKTANEEAKSNREKVEILSKQLESSNEFKSNAKGAAVIRELKAKGIKNPDRLIKLIDTDSIEFDADGGLTGMDEQFELVSTNYPELLDIKKQAPNVDQFRNESPDKKLSATEQQLAALRQHAGM